jgi:hypothetical protein
LGSDCDWFAGRNSESNQRRIEGLEEKASRRLARTPKKVARGGGRRPPAKKNEQRADYLKT